MGKAKEFQFCGHCGYENNRSNKFCSRCGQAICTARDYCADVSKQEPRSRWDKGGSMCPGIDLEPAAVGGSYWRDPAQGDPPGMCTDPVCPQCGLANAPDTRYCKSCGLIISQEIRMEIYDAFVLLKLNMKDLDFGNSKILTNAFKNLSRKKRVILDMGRVEWIDSSGIGALVTQTLRWGRYNADIRIIGLQRGVRDAVHAMQVDNVLGIRDSVNQCLDDWGLMQSTAVCGF